ncbi:hypothetical protein JYT26_01730, partial [Beggiatoa alba]|nr:hypothetical protein [Beggiatoa alba]
VTHFKIRIGAAINHDARIPSDTAKIYDVGTSLEIEGVSTNPEKTESTRREYPCLQSTQRNRPASASTRNLGRDVGLTLQNTDPA